MVIILGITELCMLAIREVEYFHGAYVTCQVGLLITGLKMKGLISVHHVTFDSLYTKENTTAETVAKYFVPNVADLKVRYPDFAF